ncbi:translational machinery component [Wolfiporia cocos MD-104 SS10]|uniref:Translational machinery component n=1 Tax=Wolfiporia cocos (strain MD-104) TaxID=742152 RepID=A0A2H3JN81_WOLCO|nr:translational machinery component [Wolfiporia cocos MD-104 SS10]
MSLLRLHLARALAASRPRSAAFYSTAGSGSGSQIDGAAWFDALGGREPSASPSPFSSGIPDLPPIGSAYPGPNPPSPVNPLRDARTTISEQLQPKPTYTIYVKATRTNTITTLTRPDGSPIRTFTGGRVGFKGTNRSSYEAGYKCVVEVFQLLEQHMEKEDLRWELYLNGFGQGREAVQKALLAGEGERVKDALVRITDKTPIKIGGTRSKKMKRR